MKKMRGPLHGGLLFLCLILYGCGPSRHGLPESLTAHSGFQPTSLKARSFDLLSYIKKTASKTLRVYIEGDGLAWISEDVISPDPTPDDPLALRLALKDHSASSVAYLARPCQYHMGSKCNPGIWTDKRFSPEILETYNIALDQLKQQTKSERLVLLGYSGGGALALLLAAQRQDVVQVITFAGLLDTAAWVKHFDLSPLKGSLNPADFLERLKSIPQTHFRGGEDDVIPPVVGDAYLRHLKQSEAPIIPGLTHHNGWEEFWDTAKANS